MPIHLPTAPDSLASPARELARELARVRLRARVMLVLQRTAWLIATATAALVVGGVADYFLRSPGWLRGIGLVGAVGLLVWAVVSIVVPAVRFKPSLTEIALRVEKMDAGRSAGLRDVLAAGLELGEREAGGIERALAGPLVEQARERLREVKGSALFAPGRTLRAVTLAVLMVVTVVTLVGAEPGLAATGLARMLWPWGGAQWPKRSAIADLTGETVHPLGSALRLRGALVTAAGGSRSALDRARVLATYRLITDGIAGPEHQVLLTNQNREVAVPGKGLGVEEPKQGRLGTLFERLIEPAGLRPENLTHPGPGVKGKLPKVELEYALSSEDDETPWSRIELVEPPAVVSAEALVQPPGYVGGDGTSVALGTGADERATAPPVLAGTRVNLAITFNKTLPAVPADAAELRKWVNDALGADAAGLLDRSGEDRLMVSGEGNVWKLSWRLKDTTRLRVKPLDEHGIGSVEESAYRFDAIKDNPPSATVTTPTTDTSVLPSAKVQLTGEGRDDVGLGSVSLERQVARKPAGSAGATPEPVGERVEIAKASPVSEGEKKRLSVSATLDLSGIDLHAGDEVWITALATDRYALDGEQHAAVRSSVRKLRVLSRQELVEQIWSELSGVRRSAITLDQDEGETLKGLARLGEEAVRKAERQQASVTERLARQSAIVQRASERIRDNGLEDASLSQVVREAQELLSKAGSESVKATEKMGDAARAEGQEAPAADAGKAERAGAKQAGQNVRDGLAGLIDLLDQGEDTFASKQAVERLLEQERELKARTGEAAKATAGKSVSQLSPEQKAALDKIAQDQRAAADAMKDAIAKMLEREQKLRQNDPAAAQAMAQAAKRAEREQVAEKMAKASKEAKENQVGGAQQEQAQAIASMEQMLEDINKAAQNRDEVLRRALASLIDSLDGLIQRQKDQLGALDQARVRKAFEGLDEPMMMLHEATLGVLDQANQGGRELAEVTKQIDAAADAQAQGVTALRSRPAKDSVAGEREGESLSRLKAARDAAAEMDKKAAERQNAQKRSELKKQYEAAYKQEVSLQEGSKALIGVEVTRRTRAAARQIGEEQAALQQTLHELKERTKALSEAKVFEYAHQRLDELMGQAAKTLGTGEAGAGTVREQGSAARLLKSLADALDDRQKKDEPFRNGEGSGGGQGGGKPPPLVPPAAEVALLRDMQMDVAELTRSGEKDGDQGALSDAARLQKQLVDHANELLERMKKEQEKKPAAPDAKGGQ